MGRHLRSLLVTGPLLALCLASEGALASASSTHNTDWFKEAKYGAFMHFLPENPRQLEQVKAFDVENLAAQLEAIGAKYFVITLGQNSGFYNAPNSVYERITGYARGERCSARDLPLDLHQALAPRGIKLMLYLPCQTPNEDRRAQKAFGVRPEAGDQPIDLEFARKWSQVIQEWSDRYGEKVAGWWFDGGYAHVGFNDSIAPIYANAVKHGNPKAIVTFNPGVQLIRWTKAEDYTAGELNDPFGQMNQVRAIKAAVRQSTSASNPPRLRRADSFLGIHYDFHAGEDCTSIGKNTTRTMIETIIDQVHPDYLQIDCKGHPGLSSYPTKVGNRAPGFVGDPLRIWRDVTAERGVALYTHYSGVWDSQAIRRHSDWGAVNADGSTNGNATSFFGPYADTLMIPQLRELAGAYGVDGAWVDGECWASVPDYSAAALKAFHSQTGLSSLPRKPGDPHWIEFLEFHRESFRKHLRHYLQEVKSTNPDMQLCSNWAFTDHMPEPVSAAVDWISGDFSPEDSVNSARFSARYMAEQGKPWDLMAWSFASTPGTESRRQKTATQLEREAAVVLASGGGFQAYFTQQRDGSVRLEELPVMAEVAKFCRARQAICHHAKPVPQVALLYSTAAHYRESNALFPRELSRIKGTLQALLESQQSVEVESEHHLTGRMGEYPLIIVPELDYLETGFTEELRAYARRGGRLLLMGPKTASLFAPELGMMPEGPPVAEQRYLFHRGSFAPTKGFCQSVRLKPSARTIGQLHATQSPSSLAQPAASVASLGKGKIAATYFSFSQGYLSDRSGTARAFLNDLVRQLFPEPLVEVAGSSDVDLSVNRIGGRLAVNLVNTAGPHANVNTPVFDKIPPVGPLSLTIKTPQKPSRITLEPGGHPLPFAYYEGKARLTVERLDIHGVVVVE